MSPEERARELLPILIARAAASQDEQCINLIAAAIRAAVAEERAEVARPASEWHDDYGPVLWWYFDEDGHTHEAPWVGSPLCDDWPGYHTHWTPCPPEPAIRKEPT